MKIPSNASNTVGAFGAALGKGLIAGLAGTAAITLSQTIERKITGKPTNFAPGDAASKALDIEASKMEARKKFSDEVNWVYGTSWGSVRGMLSLMGLKGLHATAIHWAAVFYTAITIEPDFEVAPPINEWSKKSIAMFALHHVIYAATAGLVYDAIDKKKMISREDPALAGQ
ncbi:MAG TPA: hypothetical protein VLI68_08770 [Hanamia sp.]|nr:hypothetical protein [Hanamia sp.]